MGVLRITVQKEILLCTHVGQYLAVVHLLCVKQPLGVCAWGPGRPHCAHQSCRTSTAEDQCLSWGHSFAFFQHYDFI